MSLAMTKEEREAFLADGHVGVISIAEEGRGPLTVPIWYFYEPGRGLRSPLPGLKVPQAVAHRPARHGPPARFRGLVGHYPERTSGRARKPE